MMFAIEKNVPAPAPRDRRGALKFPWETMEVGDSFFVPRSFWGERNKLHSIDNRLRNNFKRWVPKAMARRVRIQIVRRFEKDVEGHRVWLITQSREYQKIETLP